MLTSAPWSVDGEFEGRLHLVPRNDLREHVLALGCWCKPEENEVDGGVIISHNSMDNREEFETGRRQKS